MICVNSVRVTPGSVTLQAGKWYYGARAEVCPLNASCRSVRWWSENPNVASVNASSGYIYARAAGTVTIWATAIDGSGCRDCMTVLVKSAIPVESVELVPGSLSMETGSSYLLSAVVCPVNATKKSVTWCSSNTGVATVSSSGRVTAVSKGSAIITATANDGSGKCGCCQVAVTGDVLVKSITISPSSIKLIAGQGAFLTSNITPVNATNKTVVWSSSNENVVKVISTSGQLSTFKSGYATITAAAQDGSGVKGVCNVYVEPRVSVKSIELCPSKTIVGIGEDKYIYASFCPPDATNKTIEWTFRPSDKVTFSNRGSGGYVTGVASGMVDVVAKTMDGGYIAHADVKVDGREKVIVKRTGDYFTMQFSNGVVWKSVGVDLDSEPPSNIMWDPYYYDQLKPHEQRFMDNFNETRYTVKQLALIYLFDPLGLTYYVNHNQLPQNENFDSVYNSLILKDNVYREIFGKNPNKFLLDDYGNKLYYGLPSGRKDYYTDAEVVFGPHTILNMAELAEFLLDIALDLVSLAVPAVQYIQRGIDVVKVLMFSDSIIADLASGSASAFAEHCLENANFEGSKGVVDALVWPLKLCRTLNNVKDTIAEILETRDLESVQIYNRVHIHNEYRIVFESNGQDWNMEDIVSMCPKLEA